MASATLCFSGFPKDEAALIQEQFEQANQGLEAAWALASEADARFLVIDMDSMYGHMSWLKARSSGKTTVGLTTGDRSETDFVLKRPVSVAGLRALLEQLSAIAPGTESKPAEPTVASAGPSAEYLVAVTTGKMAALPSGLAHQTHLSDFLSPGALGGPAKLQLPGAPLLAFDPKSQTYAGCSTLKPLLPYVEAVLSESNVVAIEQSEFDQIKASTGGAHPYIRLLWLCGLSIDTGELLPGYSAARKFSLAKWPQIEREFPKHFRLATLMMKGPTYIKEIAEACAVTPSDVVAFVNAGLLTGAVVAEGSPPAAGDVARAVALLALPRSG
jgi:hypothetical protein